MLTDIKIKKLKFENGVNQITLSDVPHLFLIARQNKKGVSKTFVYKAEKNKKVYKKTIGKYPIISLQEARNKCNEYDTNLLTKNQLEVETNFKKILQDYYDIKIKKLKPATIKSNSNYINKLSVFYDYNINDITPELVKKYIITDTTSHRVSKVFGFLNQVFDYAENLDLIESNKIKKLSKLFNLKKSVHRKSFEVDTIEQLHDQLKSHFEKVIEVVKRKDFYKNYFYVYLLLFCLLLRITEVLTIKKSNINIKEKYVFIETTKTLESGIKIPLTNLALKIINKLKVFSSDSSDFLIQGKNHSNLQRQTLGLFFRYNGIYDIDFHGIRTVGRNFMAFNENIIPFTVAELCLTHSIGNAVTRSYLRIDYFEERKKALEMFSDFIENILKELNFEI